MRTSTSMSVLPQPEALAKLPRPRDSVGEMPRTWNIFALVSADPARICKIDVPAAVLPPFVAAVRLTY